MAKIYLPSEYLNKPCYVVNNDYIRVYNTIHQNQQNTVYDIYLDQDYMVKQTNANYSSNIQCDTINTYTDDWFSRVDLPDILTCIFILCIFVILIPCQVMFRFFKTHGIRF